MPAVGPGIMQDSSFLTRCWGLSQHFYSLLRARCWRLVRDGRDIKLSAVTWTNGQGCGGNAVMTPAILMSIGRLVRWSVLRLPIQMGSVLLCKQNWAQTKYTWCDIWTSEQNVSWAGECLIHQDAPRYRQTRSAALYSDWDLLFVGKNWPRFTACDKLNQVRK